MLYIPACPVGPEDRIGACPVGLTDRTGVDKAIKWADLEFAPTPYCRL